MLDNILSLAKQFISIKSIPGNTQDLERVLGLALSELSEFTIERFEHNNVKSALIYTSAERPKKFTVILNGHLDVIPGKDHQYIPDIKDDRLYGVGSMDMKANVACLIYAFKEVAAQVAYPIGLQLVTDEEIGGFNGTKYQIEEGVRADFVIAGEPTNFDIVHQAKGVLWVKVSAPGVTAHGAYPWRGKNAIWEMHTFLTALKKQYPTPDKQAWVTTVNVSSINTDNQAFNKIPDHCVVGLDIRFIPEELDSVLATIKTLLPAGFTLDVIAQEPPLSTDQNNLYIQKLLRASESVTTRNIILRGAQGSSDARHYTRVNGAGVEFGPLGEGIGSDEEWVNIPSLEQYYQILVNFLLLLS